VASAVTVWLWVGASFVAADAARGLRRPRRGVPESLRRGLLVLCGVAVTAGLASPTVAVGGSAPDPGVLAGLRLPERVAVSPAAQPAPPPSPDRVVVGPGDSLWSITEQRLGPGATADEIAREWPRLYAANRDVIGSDPDLVEPGQRLVLPDEEVGR
jgi:nucleoid-associated protein YgaU